MHRKISSHGLFEMGTNRQSCLVKPANFSETYEIYRSGTGVTVFTTLAGDPMATEKAGMLFVTTLPAPIVHPFPMTTPGKMTTFPPTQQSLPIATPRANSMLSRRDCTSVSWVAANMLTDGPNITRSPIVTKPSSRIVMLHVASAPGDSHGTANENLLSISVERGSNGSITSIVDKKGRLNIYVLPGFPQYFT